MWEPSRLGGTGGKWAASHVGGAGGAAGVWPLTGITGWNAKIATPTGVGGLGMDLCGLEHGFDAAELMLFVAVEEFNVLVVDGGDVDAGATEELVQGGVVAVVLEALVRFDSGVRNVSVDSGKNERI